MSNLKNQLSIQIVCPIRTRNNLSYQVVQTKLICRSKQSSCSFETKFVQTQLCPTNFFNVFCYELSFCLSTAMTVAQMSGAGPLAFTHFQTSQVRPFVHSIDLHQEATGTSANQELTSRICQTVRESIRKKQKKDLNIIYKL